MVKGDCANTGLRKQDRSFPPFSTSGLSLGTDDVEAEDQMVPMEKPLWKTQGPAWANMLKKILLGTYRSGIQLFFIREWQSCHKGRPGYPTSHSFQGVQWHKSHHNMKIVMNWQFWNTPPSSSVSPLLRSSKALYPLNQHLPKLILHWLWVVLKHTLPQQCKTDTV